MNASRTIADIKFHWYDAWPDQWSPTGASAVKNCSCEFEMAAVLFNAATLAMQCGVREQAVKQQEPLKKAKNLFLRAAGLYAAADEKAREIQGDVSVDLSSASLEMLTMLSLAHAQRCIYEYAATQETQKGLCPKLAAAAADYYEEAESHLSTKSLPMGKLLNAANQYNKWSAKILVSMLYFCAIANHKDALILKPDRMPKAGMASKAGIEIVRLEKARDVLVLARDKAKKHLAPEAKEAVKKLLEDVEKHLGEATKENDHIHYIGADEVEKLRTSAPPPAIERKTLVHDKQVGA
jgi:hypothetical protein